MILKLYLILAFGQSVLAAIFDKNFPKHCLHPSITQNGHYFINPGQEDPIMVNCENGWTTVFNKIEYKSIATTNVNYHKDFFAKSWAEYVNGFGAADTNFWIGLNAMRAMVQNEEMKLRIEANVIGQRKVLHFIEYDSFYIDAENKQFRLKIGKKTSGNLVDNFQAMNGFRFFTQDNDTNGCAEQFRGGWWLHNCFLVCLTCQPPPTSTSMNWFNTTQWLTFSRSKMMLKPVKVLQRPNSCYEIFERDNFARIDGIYYIYPDVDSDYALKVYCEMNRGGWTRVLNKVNKTLPTFDRSWAEYRDGFGDLNGNYWLGLNNIHLMTFKRPMSVRIELWNTKSDHQFIEYDSSFLVYSERDEFKMEIGKSTRGTLIDWLHTIHNGYRFHARDRGDSSRSAYTLHGGWWFGSNNKVCLTCNRDDTETWAESGGGGDESSDDGNSTIVYNYVKMMIKPGNGI